MIGQTLAHYTILEKLGSGGMGDVYLAEDTELDRKVALKILPPELAESEERRAGFKREAKAIAALNHPNIVQIYSVEQADGVHFITMELVKGKTLAELLPKKGFSLDKFFEVATPLADAVAAAHEQRVIHRDLKPGNLMVTDDWRVKVLDFGLARTEPVIASDIDSESPTELKSQQGVLAGTAHYMSPEQAQGKKVDARSDIFSLGIVLYEMLVGRRPFEGETLTEVLSSIIKDTPPAARELRPEISPELSRLVRRCLAKDPSRRIQTALDIRNELEELSSAETPEISVRERTHAVNKWLAALAAGLLVALGAVLFYFNRGEAADMRLENADQLTSTVGVEDYPTWSPDGDRVAYEARPHLAGSNWDIWVAQIGGTDAVNLTAGHNGPDRFPSWGPDGRQIAFLSERDEIWSLYTMSSIGGNPRRLLSLPTATSFSGWSSSPQWSEDGSEIAFPVHDAGKNYLEIVSFETRNTRRIELPEHDGKLVLDLSWESKTNLIAYVTAIHRASRTRRLWIFSASKNDAVAVTDGLSNDRSPLWSSDGRSLFFVSNRGGSTDLWQQSISDGRPVGEPKALTTGVSMRSARFDPDRRRLAYSRGRPVANLWRTLRYRLRWRGTQTGDPSLGG